MDSNLSVDLESLPKNQAARACEYQILRNTCDTDTEAFL